MDRSWTWGEECSALAWCFCPRRHEDPNEDDVPAHDIGERVWCGWNERVDAFSRVKGDVYLWEVLQPSHSPLLVLRSLSRCVAIQNPQYSTKLLLTDSHYLFNHKTTSSSAPPATPPAHSKSRAPSISRTTKHILSSGAKSPRKSPPSCPPRNGSSLSKNGSRRWRRARGRCMIGWEISRGY